ncbi:MAG: hypothetical protein K2G56_00265 [Eubacterium sp.]|nr:hypothetical protein [Eubacterium sp.]
MKPHASVRLDTSVQRIEVINPDLYGNTKRAVDDPTVKGSSRTAVYMDQVVNEGSSVRSFWVDYRVPFRGTVEGTREEAPVTADWIPNRLYAVGTGNWEVPESVGEEYRNVLKEKLRVKVYAMFVEDPKLTDDGFEDADVSYEGINNLWEGDWINLTELHNKKTLGINSDSVPIYENNIIDITSIFDELPGTVYQLRYVIESDDPEYIVPHGFRLAVDADDDSDNGSQEMDEIDPNRENVNPLPESVTTDIVYNTDGTINYEESRVGNAAFVVTTMTNMNPRKRHVNFFASAMAHYDELQSHKAVISERARAGYYITRELPVLETDLTAQYFKNSPNLDPDTGEELNWSFKWDNDILISSSSNMLKFSSSLYNLSQEAIDETNIKNTLEDTATNIQMSVVLPFIQNIDSTIESEDEDSIEYRNYKYVEYGSDAWANSINKDFESPKAFAGNFTPVWTWHVENEDGEVIASQVDNVSLVMDDKVTDITNSRERRVLTFSTDGVLNPGEKIVIDFMLPISTNYSGIVSDDLMNCKNFGFKSGAFVPYIPQVDASSKTYAYEVDTRDVNSNEIRNSENTVTTSISVISFVSEAAFNRAKVSFSEYGSGNTVMGNDFNRPSLVPEGTKYSFLSSVVNPDTDPQSQGYNQPVIYDVLPFVGDTTLTPQVGGVVKDRGSDWRGYLQLDSLQVTSQMGINQSTLVNDKDVTIWIGPFNYDNKAVGKIKEIKISDLPTVSQTADAEFYKTLRKSNAEKQKYFVKLTDLLNLKTANPDRFEELQRHAQAIYVEPAANYYLTPNTKLSVSYELKAPLNLPLFDGYSPEETSDTLVTDVSNVDGWNTFTAQTEERPVTESPEAGVYLAAPADKGYIGHYVWLDESYNAEFFDEADYYQKDGEGRWLLDKATKDLDYDGDIDDPGINGVKVELLSAKGYPVNKLGEAVVEVDGRYCLIDENTGLLKRDTANNLMYTTLGPVSYTTEKDAYGNDGYFIISNITPGSYKLRYTFPETGEYDKYALTTRRIGQTKVPMTVYRPGSTLPNLGNAGKGDEPTDGATVNTLVIQTDTAIRVDAVGTDPSKYAAYDEKMTSYDLGVAPSFAYGGYAWREITSQINGLKDEANASTGFRKENGIKDILIAIYEVVENPNAVDEKDKYDYRYAYDADGKQIVGRYNLKGDTLAASNKRVYLRTDENGYFKTTLCPYKSYIAVAYHEDSLAPSPVTLSSFPLKFELDNDMSYNHLMDRDTTSVFAANPKNDEYDMGKCVNGQYGTYNRLGFAFTSTGVGSIGKYAFIDENYDGLRNEYIDDDGYIVSEHGLENVRFVLERWYYNPAATRNKWVYVGDVADTVSVGNAYTFVIDNDDFYYTVDDPGTMNHGKTFVCGYKVKVDMDSVAEVSKNAGTQYVPTKYLMNDGVSDSNLPLTGGNYRYLNDVPVIANEIVDEADLDPSNPEQIKIDGVTYDMTRGRSITDLDAGFATVDTAHIKGIVWNDENYDGIRNTSVDEEGNTVSDEKGVSDVELQLIPYAYHKDARGRFRWYPLTADDLADPSIFDEYNEVKTKSDSDGVYDFSGVRPTAVLNDEWKNELCIVGYKIKVNSDITDMGYGITKYLTNGKVDDSELRVDGNGVMVLNADNDYIITAKQTADEDLDYEYGSDDVHHDTNHKELLIVNNLGNFDVNKVTDWEGNDAGLIEFKMNSISGRVWVDTNYDGVMDDTELGLEEEYKLTVKRYYLENGGIDPDEGIGNWVEDEDFKSPVVTIDADGNYIFEDLPAQVYKDGNYYLAGYKVFAVDHPDMSTYAITLYGKYGENQRGSDLKGLELIEKDEYIILAEKCGTYKASAVDTTAGSEAAAYKNLSYVVKYQGTYYDVVAAHPKTELDAGYTDYKSSVIKGNVFEDIDYDGLYGGEDTFTDALKTAIYDSVDEKVIITASAFYYDPEEDEWNVYSKLNGFNFLQETFVTEVTVDSDGSFELEVPTKFNVGGVNYLAGYKLSVNIIPNEFHVTKYLANNGIDDNVLNKNDDGDYWLTKTIPGGVYSGSLMEEMDGFVIAASPSDGSASSNLVAGYDIAGTRTLEDYNVGYTARQVASIDGYVYKDNNYNGKYDLRSSGVPSSSDTPISGVRIGLKRYVLVDDSTNTWEEANNDQEYYRTIRTDRNGRYNFNDLPTHREAGEYGDIPLLYGYTVWLLDRPTDANGNPLAATYYQYNHERYDSALLADTMQIIKDDQGYNGPGEYFDSDIGRLTIIADPVDVEDTLQYVVAGYNVVQGMSRWAYSVGLVDYQKASITGNVFDDINYDGLIDDADPKFSDFEIGIKRYKLVDGAWAPAQPEDEEYFAVVSTDENGDYLFDNLDIYTVENDTNILYGYEIFVVDAPEGFTITKYQKNNGDNDSSVLLGKQIIKSDTGLDEMYDGKLVLGKKSTRGVHDMYIIDGYDIVRAHNLDNYNAGYIEQRFGSISGTVFDDKSYDGTFDADENGLSDVEITLKRFTYENEAWVEDEDYVNTALTDENGNYIFENLETYTEKDGVRYLCGYEVWVTEHPEGYAVTRYQNDSKVLLNRHIIKPDTNLDEVIDGKIVVAPKVEEDTTGIDPSHIIDGRNVILAEDITEYDAGYKAQEKGSISGIVFDDKDYDGNLDEEDGRLENVEVTLKRFVFVDNEWIDDPEFYVETLLTDENGVYSFENLDTYVTDEDGNNHLYGYEVWVTDGTDGYAITRYQNDSYVLLNGHIFKPDTKLPEMLDGKIVVAQPVDDKSGIDESFIIENYNIIFAEDITEYNAGYVKAQKGSISGIVFDDKNYDGALNEEDALMSGVEVTLKRFVLVNGEWKDDLDFDVKALTDKNGAYRFDNLDTYVADELENNYLYGYEVWVTGAPNGYAVTKYGTDSYLFVNGQIIKPDTKLPEMLGGKIVVAQPVDDKSGIDESFIIANYNIIFAEDIVDYNAGYKLQEFASISGNVFDDIHYDGLIDDEDNMLSGIQIGLKRFVYEDSEWKLAQNEDEEFYQTTATSEDGGYIFNNLETYVNDNGVNKLYGYELYVIGIEDRLATKYQMNNGDNDSALVADTKQIIKKDTKLSEMLDGKLVVAKPVGDDVQNTPYIVENYDVVQGVDLTQYNAGLVPVREYSISGYVWNDANRDGFISDNEKFMSNVNVTLERLYFYEGQWRELPQEEMPEDVENPTDTTEPGENELDVQNDEQSNSNEESETPNEEQVDPNVAVTDENGYYIFDHLPLYTVVDGNRVVCGYRVKMEELPSQYAVTVLHANDLIENEDAEETATVLYDNDLNDKTGYLEDPAALIVLAETSDETTPDYYNIDNFNISYGESVEHLDAGVVPFGVGSIAGVLFEDANENGVYDDGELIFEGETIYLDYFVAENSEEGGDASEGKFVSFNDMKVVTDANGWFIFDNLPILDENNQPYIYRLNMNKPSERGFTKSYGFVIMGEDKLNILSQQSDEDENAGVTPVITLAIPRTDDNYYGLKWQIDGYNHTNAYLGLSTVENSEKVYTGSGDFNPLVVVVPASALGMLLLVLIVAKSKKRKETD